jgi:hypothetical protein
MHRIISPLVAAACSAAIAIRAAGQTASPIAVHVDSARHTVILSAGPFELPIASDDMSADAHGGGMNAHTLAVPLLRFIWPVDGWIRGIKVRVIDRAGRPLPRELVHHLMVINFGRRELLYPQAERLIAVGQETPDVHLPSTIGIPVTTATPMAVIMAWHNAGHDPVSGAIVEVSVEWSPPRTAPRPISVLPVPVNIFYPVGRAGDFDLPPGPMQWTADVSFPLSGHILVAGGHQHDFGTGFEFQEVTAGGSRSIFRLGTKLTSEGHLLSVDRITPGAAGDGIKLATDHKYRMIATYNNRTGKTLVNGAMANLVLLFSPDHLEAWPALSASDPEYRRDLRYLESLGQ